MRAKPFAIVGRKLPFVRLAQNSNLQPHPWRVVNLVVIFGNADVCAQIRLDIDAVGRITAEINGIA